MNYHDVANLNESFAGLGEALLKNRMMAEQKQERTRSAGIQERELGLRERNELLSRQMEQDHLTETKRHNQAVEGAKDEGHVNAWLQGPEGATVEFTGPQSSLDKIVSGSQAQGKPLKVVDKPDKLDSYASITKDTPAGKMTFHPRDEKEFDAITSKIKTIPNVPSGPSDVQTDQAAADLEGQAGTAADAEIKKALTARAMALRSGIGRQDPGEYNEETTVESRDDEGRPVKTTKRRVKAAAAATAGASGAALPKDKTKLVAGTVYNTARGPARWTGAAFVPQPAGQ